MYIKFCICFITRCAFVCFVLFVQQIVIVSRTGFNQVVFIFYEVLSELLWDSYLH